VKKEMDMKTDSYGIIPTIALIVMSLGGCSKKPPKESALGPSKPQVLVSDRAFVDDPAVLEEQLAQAFAPTTTAYTTDSDQEIAAGAVLIARKLDRISGLLEEQNRLLQSIVHSAENMKNDGTTIHRLMLMEAIRARAPTR
jgi:hypothetical protein